MPALELLEDNEALLTKKELEQVAASQWAEFRRTHGWRVYAGEIERLMSELTAKLVRYAPADCKGGSEMVVLTSMLNEIAAIKVLRTIQTLPERIIDAGKQEDKKNA